jgi:integrase
MSVRKRLTKHGETRWVADYRDASGIRRNRQFATKGEAVVFAAQVRGEIVAGVHVPHAASIEVRHAAELWLAKARREGLEATTLLDMAQHSQLHILPYLGTTRLTRLTVPVVTAFRDQLLDSGRSSDMVRRVLGSLSAIVNVARQRGLVAVNNVPLVARPRRGRSTRRPVIPTREELSRLIAASGQHRAFILTAILTGMRASELRGLIWANVDLKQGIVHVRQRADRYRKIGPPKSRAGTRDIPVSPLLLNTLKSWRLASPPNPLDLVFPAADGRIQTNNQIMHNVLVPVQIAAGVTIADDKPKYALHALRHSCASLWIAQQMPPKRIQQLMGHHSITMTFDTYGHLFPQPREERDGLELIALRLVE